MKDDYSTLNVWLPAGTDWYEWHTGTMLKGWADGNTYFCHKRFIPIYIKAGSVLPFCGRVKSLAGDDHSYVVTVSGRERIFDLYEDNGNDKSTTGSMPVHLCSPSMLVTVWK